MVDLVTFIVKQLLTHQKKGDLMQKLERYCSNEYIEQGLHTNNQ